MTVTVCIGSQEKKNAGTTSPLMVKDQDQRNHQFCIDVIIKVK